MRRTTVMLPSDLQARAMRQARTLGVSLAELVRESLEARLERLPRTHDRDPLFADEAVYGGSGLADLAAEHDDYLYGK